METTTNVTEDAGAEVLVNRESLPSPVVTAATFKALSPQSPTGGEVEIDISDDRHILPSRSTIHPNLSASLSDCPPHPLFSIEQLGVDRRLIVNRKRQLKMYRVWMQGKFVKVA